MFELRGVNPRQRRFPIVAIGLVVLVVSGCAPKTATITTTLIERRQLEPLVDLRDGRSYTVAQIGNQVWMTRNMAFPTQPSWCYDGRPEDCEANGRLYPWEKAHEACPAGWHLPTDEEWAGLEAYLGMSKTDQDRPGVRGTTQGTALRKGGVTGFDADTLGYRQLDGSYVHRGDRSAYWTGTEAEDSTAWDRSFRSDDGGIERDAVSKAYGLNVRCLRD